MGDETRVIKGKMEMAGLAGPIWVMGWLFTIGFAHLHTVKIVFAIVIWPYYLGGTLTQ